MLQWSRLELVRTLNEGNGQSTGGFRLLRSGRTRAVLATAQMAAALVLLVGAGLLLRSFVGLVTVDPLAVVAFLREAVADAHPRAAVDDISTMNARLWAAVVQPRSYALFAGGFAAFALFLAAFGVYGLLSYTVSQRRQEIGVRMALGARRGDIVALVVRQGGALVAAGAVLGLLAAAASSRVLESFLYGVGTDDRLTFAAGPLVLVAAALAACWLRRAGRPGSIRCRPSASSSRAPAGCVILPAAEPSRNAPCLRS